MSTINLIQEKLNLSSQNLNLISDNIANVNTVGYQRKYLDVQGASFSSALSTKLKQTNDKHIKNSKSMDLNAQEVDAYIRTDENGVDIEQEVVEMGKNQLFYNSLVTLLNNELTSKKNILTSK